MASTGAWRWRYDSSRSENVRNNLASAVREMPCNTAEDLVTILSQTCSTSLKGGRATGKRNSVYWWSNEIGKLHKDVTKKRRTLKRSLRHRGFIGASNNLEDAYRDAKRQLTLAIKTSKTAKWRELCTELNNDPWGDAYKIVRKKNWYTKTNNTKRDRR